MKTDVLLGLQWGDEGKGKIVDVLTPNYDIIARFQGGPNAGHTLEFNGIKHVLHTIPSGIFHDENLNVIGNGVVIDPIIFKKETDAIIEKFKISIDDLRKKLLISKRAHLILPTHILLDKASEAAKGEAKIGSTQKGIGPTYMDKTGRNGLRAGDILLEDFKSRYDFLVNKHIQMLKWYNYDFDLTETEKKWFEAIDNLRKFELIDSEQFLNDSLKKGQKILAEGAQGSLLDIDFGTYPFVTSSNTVTAGACTGLGIAPGKIGKVIGIFKAYCTRVGSGPFPTELNDETGELIRKTGNEFGSTTGRARRCGWLDLPALKYAIMINGVTELMMMKADVLNDLSEIKVCTSYNYNGNEVDVLPYSIDQNNLSVNYTTLKGWKSESAKTAEKLPDNLINYINFIEKETGVPITIVSMGPDRKQTIFLSKQFA
jgi:adenylosuccinate synthase